MREFKRLLKLTALAGVFGASLLASSSFAGPLILGPVQAPVSVPKVFVVPIVKAVPVHTQFLSTYRQVRAFWLSRAIVR